MTREELKPMIENFMSSNDHNEKELMVSVKLYGDTIADFHISEEGRDITEKSTLSKLMISNIYSDFMGLAPDVVLIKYEKVKNCTVNTLVGENETDIIAEIMTLSYENGTDMELGFLAM